MAASLSFQPITQSLSEVEALSRMAGLTFTDTFRHYESADIESYLKNSLSPEALSKEIEAPENHFYFVLYDGERVGYIKWITPSAKYREFLPGEWRKPFLLERFYFLPEHCGKGLGQVALAFVESQAKYIAKADILYLSVWDKNYRAQSFYQKHGFRTLASFDYPVGEEIDHELLYGKKL